MKKRIAFILSVVMTLSYLLGAFTFTAAAADATSTASINSYEAAVVGFELQIAVDATNAETYKLYESSSASALGTAVLEVKTPIIVYNSYDSAKYYSISVVDANGAESAAVSITEIEALPEADYDANNILLNKIFQLSSLTAANVNSGDYGNADRLTNGDFTTGASGRFAMVGKSDIVFEGIVPLNDLFKLHELKIYQYYESWNGEAPGQRLGSTMAVDVYKNGMKTNVLSLSTHGDIEALLSNDDIGYYLSVDLSGYEADYIRIYFANPSSNGSGGYYDFSFREITCSGIKGFDTADETYSTNLFSGKTFTYPDVANYFWSGAVANITDNSYSTFAKRTGALEITVELDTPSVLDSFSVKFENTGAGIPRCGSNIKLEGYYDDAWHEIIDYTLDASTNTIVLDLGVYNVEVEKVRYTANGKHSLSDTISIAEVSCTGFVVDDSAYFEVKDNVFSGYVFEDNINTNIYAGSYVNLTDGNANNTSRLCSSGASSSIDGTLTFGGRTAILNEITLVYGQAKRCGANIQIDVIYNGITTTVVDHTYEAGVTTQTFELGGVRAEAVRIYVSKALAISSLTGDCIEFYEISCTGSISTFLDVESDNILVGKTFEPTADATAVHSASYTYDKITDSDTTTTRYSSKGTSSDVFDAIVSISDKYALDELRIYDFNAANTHCGTNLKIAAYTGGSWREIISLGTLDEIKTHRVGKYLSFDLGGINASQLRVTIKTPVSGQSISIYEITCSGSYSTTNDEAKQDSTKNEYKDGNILLGIPASKISLTGLDYHTNPTVKDLTNAFDGDLATRYAVQDSKIASTPYSLTIDLSSPTRLYVLSIKDWRNDTSTQLRSDKTTIEVLVDGMWVVKHLEQPLNNPSTKESYIYTNASGTAAVNYYATTDFDLGGVIATAIRITFNNTSYIDSTGLYPSCTPIEISCTGDLCSGDLIDIYNDIADVDTSSIFGLTEVKNQKLEDLIPYLVVTGLTDAEILAKAEYLQSVEADYIAGIAPETTAYGDFSSYNLSLAGDIGVNFYGALSGIDGASVAESFPDAFVVYEYVSVYDKVATTLTETKKLSELTTDASGRYIFTLNTPACQMTDTIKIRLVLNGDTCGEVYETTVREYADVILNGSYTDSEKNLVKAMLNYGGMAQTYFGYNTDNLANSGISVDGISGSLNDATFTIDNSEKVSGIAPSHWSLVLDSSIKARIYFESESIGNYTFTYTDPSGSEYALDTVAIEKIEILYYVEIEISDAKYIDDVYTLNIISGSKTATITFNAISYKNNSAAVTNDVNLQNLCTAMELYCAMANAYSAN